MQQKFHKEMKYFISFLLVTTLFIIGSFFLPHNFRGLIFYGLIFVIDWIMMRTIFPLYQLKKPWKTIVFIIHWLPLLILSSIVLIAIIIPFPIWESWLKKILILLAISGIVAQIVGFLFVIVYLLLRLFWHNSKKLRYIIDTGLSVMSIVFCLFITSPLWTQTPVIKYVNIPVQQLPAQFENYTIVQISDLHLDYASKRTIDRSVAMINAEHPDLIAVTGDMVTFHASEMDTYLPLLQQLQAVNGIYCVMGNHDYGSYAFKENSDDYHNNLTQLQQNYQTLHWHLLNNEFAYIVKEQDTLVIAGTENQSLKKMFQSFGDIHQTLKDISGKHPIILMTHDPNYWTQELYKMQEPIVLTLSGHTHGMQIGMNTHWCRWSLYEWMMSPYWGGLYEKNGKYLYINLGLGQTAFPGRIGLRPEITVFKLISPSE